MKMNDQTKLVFAIEHILHLQDLIADNKEEKYLAMHLSSLKVEVENQLHELQTKKKRVIM
tara:strand:+ start:308 stop:487 length:180 start_codon:yes stop_codon:yes gene_type:complete